MPPRMSRKPSICHQMGQQCRTAPLKRQHAGKFACDSNDTPCPFPPMYTSKKKGGAVHPTHYLSKPEGAGGLEGVAYKDRARPPPPGGQDPHQPHLPLSIVRYYTTLLAGCSRRNFLIGNNF